MDKNVNIIKKSVYASLGIIFVSIGILGIFLPLLPTTVFFILASYFFMKSSEKLNDWLINHKYFGVYLRNYREKTGVPLKSKISSITILWVSILVSGIFFTESLIVRFVLFAVAIGVTTHIWTIKTAVPKLKTQQNILHRPENKIYFNLN